MGKSKQLKTTEPLAAGIILGAFLLCMALSAFGYGRAQAAAQRAARQAVGAAAQVADSSRLFAGYTQLEDPLLVLVNNWVPLPEGWEVTPRMVDDELVDLRMYEDYTAMCRAAAQEDVWFWVASGYRSVEEQRGVLGRAIGEGEQAGLTAEAARQEALRTIARPGYSEHHTGLAIDLNDVSSGFEDTPAYAWLQRRGADYGFIQRYQGDKSHITGIDNESWHYRYVGKKHAKEMRRLDMCLEEYVVYLQKQGVR